MCVVRAGLCFFGLCLFRVGMQYYNSSCFRRFLVDLWISSCSLPSSIRFLSCCSFRFLSFFFSLPEVGLASAAVFVNPAVVNVNGEMMLFIGT